MNDTLSQLEYAEQRSAVERRSVHVDCQREEACHKWIESEKAGYDLDEAAVRQWVRDHWDDYLRARWVEHLEGRQFWIELDRGDFGLLQQLTTHNDELFNPIVEKLKAGQENLNILCWAGSCGQPVERVHQILETLDVNGRRLRHRFDDRRQ